MIKLRLCLMLLVCASRYAYGDDDAVRNLAGQWRWDVRNGDTQVYRINASGDGAFEMRWMREERADGARRICPCEDVYTGAIKASTVSGTFFVTHNYQAWGCGIVRVRGTFTGRILDDGTLIRINTRTDPESSCALTKEGRSSELLLQKIR